MISKNCIKHINSLEKKKFRLESGTFIASGEKTVAEILRSKMKIKTIFAVKSWISANASKFKNIEIQEVNEDEMQKITVMQSLPSVIAEVFFKEDKPLKLDSGKLYLALDSLRDPGNFGTIIRIADWFGIDGIIASEDCVDMYNSKTVQASMGSVFRVDVFYADLSKTLKEAQQKNIPVYGTFLEGENIYKEKLSKNGIIVLGNEGHGILEETKKYITKKLFIPFGADKDRAPESLNVSAATAVVCSEFFRRKL
ncbi:MAG: RNA methyltransferase [Bacteroidales bacterium]|nr:RNA methyltransferase [Bacteroidales bacterium]